MDYSLREAPKLIDPVSDCFNLTDHVSNINFESFKIFT